MAEDDDRRRWPQSRRFEFIEWKLFWEGQLNRSDLEETFSISTPQASVDLRNYRELTGDNMVYDATEKAFRPTANLAPRFLRVSADRLLLQLRAWMTGALTKDDLWFRAAPPVEMAPDIVRHLDPACLRQVLGAIRTRQALAIRYQSLTSSRWRRIAPHALVFDGYRWHARAFCCERRDFRDFVLTRIDETGDLHAVEFDVNDDLEWTTQVTLKLCPHPGLTSDQSEAVQRDFNMTRGCRDITVRASMAYYFIKRMNLDLLDLPADRAQIALQNLAEVQAAILAAKQASVELVARNAAEALQAGKDNS